MMAAVTRTPEAGLLPSAQLLRHQLSVKLSRWNVMYIFQSFYAIFDKPESKFKPSPALCQIHTWEVYFWVISSVVSSMIIVKTKDYDHSMVSHSFCILSSPGLKSVIPKPPRPPGLSFSCHYNLMESPLKIFRRFFMINVIQEVLEITSSNGVKSGEGLDNDTGHNHEKWPPESNRADTGLWAHWVSRRVKLDKQTP